MTAEQAAGGPGDSGARAGDPAAPGSGAEALTERLEAVSERMTDSHQRMVDLLDGAIAQMSAQPAAAIEDHTASPAAPGPPGHEVPPGDADADADADAVATGPTEAVVMGPTETVATGAAAGKRPTWMSNLIVGLVALVVLLLAVEIVNVV